jgi:insertion element IS1 protein InsB
MYQRVLFCANLLWSDLERKHLTLRTRINRLGRKSICFSKSVQMHELLIGLFINRFEFGLAV